MRGRPRNRWQDEVRKDGRIVGVEGWQEKVHNGEEWKKLLRTARNRCILYMPIEWMKIYMFRTVPLPIIRSLFTVHLAMVYVILKFSQMVKIFCRIIPPRWFCTVFLWCFYTDMFPLSVWHWRILPLLSVQWINSWWWTQKLSETCSFTPKWICEISAFGWFYYKEICYNARSYEQKKGKSRHIYFLKKLQKNGFLNIQSQLTIVSRFVKYQNLGLQHSSWCTYPSSITSQLKRPMQ